jgi:hypothetical protein
VDSLPPRLQEGRICKTYGHLFWMTSSIRFQISPITCVFFPFGKLVPHFHEVNSVVCTFNLPLRCSSKIRQNKSYPRVTRVTREFISPHVLTVLVFVLSIVCYIYYRNCFYTLRIYFDLQFKS